MESAVFGLFRRGRIFCYSALPIANFVSEPVTTSAASSTCRATGRFSEMALFATFLLSRYILHAPLFVVRLALPTWELSNTRTDIFIGTSSRSASYLRPVVVCNILPRPSLFFVCANASTTDQQVICTQSTRSEPLRDLSLRFSTSDFLSLLHRLVSTVSIFVALTSPLHTDLFSPFRKPCLDRFSKKRDNNLVSRN